MHSLFPPISETLQAYKMWGNVEKEKNIQKKILHIQAHRDQSHIWACYRSKLTDTNQLKMMVQYKEEELHKDVDAKALNLQTLIYIYISCHVDAKGIRF